MKYIFLSTLMFFCNLIFGQDITGTWKTIDDSSQEAKSYVDIWKGSDGKYYGKVTDILNPADKRSLCAECKGNKYNKPILGLRIIEALSKVGEEYKNGTILDPENGREYKCKIWIDGLGNLIVRGYWGPFYRSQTWLKT